MDIHRIGVGTRMSQGVAHGDLIWLAGQCGTAGAPIAAQTREALAKIDGLLAELGSDKTRILSTTIWLSDIGFYDAVKAVWDAWMPEGHAPARACGETPLAGEGYDIEIICVAARKA